MNHGISCDGGTARRSYHNELHQIVSLWSAMGTVWTWLTFRRLLPWPSLACYGNRDGESNSVSLTIVSEGLATAIH